MTRFKYFFVLVIGVSISIVGCTSKVERNISSLEAIVTDVETNGENYSSEDWECINQGYEEVTEQISESSEKLTPKQNREIGRLYARYHKAVEKHAISSFSDYMKAASEQLKGYSEEMFGDDGDSFLEDIDGIEDLFDDFE